MLENMEMNDIFEQCIKQNVKKSSVKMIHTQDTDEITICTCIRLSFFAIFFEFNEQNKLANNN